MRDDTITLEIREEYTPEEMSESGKKLAGKLADIDSVANEKKAADALFNQRRTELEKEAETLYRQINKGYEMAQVGCDIRYNDPAPGQKSYYRLDTSAIVKTEDMTWEEKQEEIQFNLNAPAEGQPQPSEDQVDDALGKITDSTELPPPPKPDTPPDEAAGVGD